jgi:hypothetical protein
MFLSLKNRYIFMSFLFYLVFAIDTLYYPIQGGDLTKNMFHT